MKGNEQRWGMCEFGGPCSADLCRHKTLHPLPCGCEGREGRQHCPISSFNDPQGGRRQFDPRCVLQEGVWQDEMGEFHQ